MFLLAAVAALALSQPAMANDPTITGKWELNVAASKTTGTMPKSVTRTYEATRDHEKMNATVITADGKTVESSFDAAYDGKDHPWKGPEGDTISITKVDPLTNSFIIKRDGKVVLTGNRTLAKDGKTMTLTSKGTNAEGKPIEATMVYDRK